MTIKQYRVKVVVEDGIFSSSKTKYLIQKRWLGMWLDVCNATTDKNWAYQTCEEMNTPYNEMRDKMTNMI